MDLKYTPQLATLAQKPPSGEQWLHEIKHDGYRMGCVLSSGKPRLISRNGNDWTPKFAEVIRAAQALRIQNAVFDGELAVLLPDGRTTFQGMQNLGSSTNRRSLVYFVFDLLQLEDRDLRPEPLHARKELLRSTIPPSLGILRYVDYIVGDGAAVLERACAFGVEGIVSKRRDRPHRAGRSTEWVKVKCLETANFVIGGFTEPEGSRVGIGALLLGYYDGDDLIYAGRVGTGRGFTTAFLAELRRSLDPMRRPNCPFAGRSRAHLPKSACWVSPDLVCSVSYVERTADGHLRHPTFVGFCPGTDPRSVIRSA